ncbi:flagellar basal body rod protein FlgC [Helicobacter pylori]|uniref:Flagellar basal-body rod protein FlgC n=1 Tax=Helicobacter pylori HP260AFii TaxID=1159077 RepID=A0ABC9S7A9_HELPX|nr:flagellar basal body rod protein FlgC [Helicobacter pylori]EMH18424.1 flagellar basal-body rod protein FlgC [Helicobacter pylori GAM260ASi]EMH28461.1 flagellar basal-body rod protein FlgC [Helicobacter pylori GAM268Bii]EMH64444.1 flagellar basal-body rod protein FlgC [Helicobacter pylori HP260AFii]EMH65088.1 flagellar basal-body rod protein FlgC [Helicobacter pylori HP260AFi]EMH66507.1 flagellar basal-body rod protein FlgC [Helicobacter pylori HP260ASii]
MFLSSFDISGYGLSAQRLRANLISSNIANANTTRTSEGGPYRRQEAVFRAFDFNEILNQKIAQNNQITPYEDPLDEGDDNLLIPITSVVVDKIARDDSEPLMKYDPSHPDANAQGYVAYPNVNAVVEMADLVEATRAYQANVAAFQSAKNMAQNAIGMLQT